MATLKLARIMYNENPLLFTNLEGARLSLRYIEGKVGALKRERVKDTPFYVAEERPRNPYNLPTSDETVYEPFVLSGHKRIAVLSDMHIPYHSMSALTAAIDFCKKDKPDACLLNGDVLDMFQLSKFSRDPRKRHFAEELKAMEQLLAVLQKTLKCQMYFKYGNHSKR